MTDEIADLKAALTFKPKRTPIPPKDFLSTGSTILNLACTGMPNAGWPKGHYVFLVGDSASGKSWLTLTCLAEAAINKNFDNYRFIHDNAEGGTLMDIPTFFGQAVADRLEEPERGTSTTVEGFYYSLDTELVNKKPCIYILDSMDALSSDEEVDKFEERKEAHSKGKTTTGTYGTSKAKVNSSYIHQVIPKLRETKSILIVVSQTRDNIGFGSQFNPKTRGGGTALRFYSDLEIWSSIRSIIKTKVSGNDVDQGITVRLKLKKNRINGRLGEVEFPIYHSYGMDDIGGTVDWLCHWKHWKKEGKKKGGDDDKSSGPIIAKEWLVSLKREDLIDHIQKKKLQVELKDIAAGVMREIEEESAIKREPRYK